MKVIIQRVRQASCSVDNQIVSSINKGFLCLVGFCPQDDKATIEKVTNKLLSLRSFDDEDGKMNQSLEDVNGELLVISQFTLYADCKKGRRPSFVGAAPAQMADELYKYMLTYIANQGYPVSKGVFQADMQIELINDGPCTIILDSKELL